MNHKLSIDLNLVEQYKEVKELWNQDTAYAKKKRKEFLDSVMKIGGIALVAYLLGKNNGIKQGAKYGTIGNVNVELKKGDWQ